MFKASQRDIKHGFEGVKRLAQTVFAQGDTEQTLKHVEQCATLAQQFNFTYADYDLENLLKQVGEKLLPASSSGYVPIKDRVVFYDDFCVSFVLAIQYLDALVTAKKDILYITLDGKSGKFNSIIDRIKDYPRLNVKIVHKTSRVDTAKAIYQSILDYKPEKLLLHIYGTSWVMPVLYGLPKNIEKYIINLADQTFWLGAGVMDYVLEFRQFGVSVSQQRRGIKPEQQLLVPFYPVYDANPFEGFPKECTSDKVIIFSGGDLYKVLDKKRTYWHLVKRLLDTYPDIVFLFATKISKETSRQIDAFIKENDFEGRFIYVNYRKDIYEVFKHCDIYMGTCPASGSLMSQLAAVNAKPILQYYYPDTPDDETEQSVCFNEKYAISFQDEEHFMEEAHRLITDVDYRKKQGERLKNAMITPEQFNKLVADTLSSNKTQVPLEPFKVNYTLLDKRWYALEKAGYTNTMPYIWGILGKQYIRRHMPLFFIKKKLNIVLKICHDVFSS